MDWEDPFEIYYAMIQMLNPYAHLGGGVGDEGQMPIASGPGFSMLDEDTGEMVDIYEAAKRKAREALKLQGIIPPDEDEEEEDPTMPVNPFLVGQQQHPPRRQAEQIMAMMSAGRW